MADAPIKAVVPPAGVPLIDVAAKTNANGQRQQTVTLGDDEGNVTAPTVAAMQALVKLMAAAVAINVPAGAGSLALAPPGDAPGRIMGFAVRETTNQDGASAQIRFRDGADATGAPLGSGITLAQNESIRDWFGPAGIAVTSRLFLERVSGTTEVTVYWSAA